jgi:glycosyltransferase involved in cell wall biosynthesis
MSKQTQARSISIIIPVYNEQDHLKRCLQAIAQQTVQADEVIVVDNNSTDQSIAVARRFPFVRVIHEKKQGFIPARNTGMNAAKSGILARIDADAQLAPDWVERVKADFGDPAVQGLTGLGHTGTLPRTHFLSSTLWARVYFRCVTAFYGTRMLWGANMAIRRTTWQQIRADACPDQDIVHEDQDLSLLIAARGGLILKDRRLMITTSGQDYHYFPKFVHYIGLWFSTRKHHKQMGSFDSPDFPHLSLPVRLVGWLVIIIVTPPFYIVSALLFPLDQFMTRNDHGRRKQWLD